MLVNAGFEDAGLTGGDVFGAAGWMDFGGATYTVHTSILGSVGAASGDHAFKMFGGCCSGIYQEFPSAPGDMWEGSVEMLNFSGDALANGQVGAVNIEWIDAAGTQLSFVSGETITASTAQDSWITRSVSGTAPAGTAMARLTLITGDFLAGGPGGAPFYDDASFQMVPEPGSISLLGAALLAGLGLRRRS